MRYPAEMHFCAPKKISQRPQRQREATHLEEIPRLSHHVEQEGPSCHLRLPRAAHDDLQCFVKVVQKVDDPRQDGVLIGSDLSRGRRGRWPRRSCVGFVLQDGVKEDLEGVGEVDEVLVMRGEDDGLLALGFREVETQNVVQEEVGLWR